VGKRDYISGRSAAQGGRRPAADCRRRSDALERPAVKVGEQWASMSITAPERRLLPMNLSRKVRTAPLLALLLAASLPAQDAKDEDPRAEKIKKSEELKFSLSRPEGFEWDRVEWANPATGPRAGFALRKLYRTPVGDGYYVGMRVSAHKYAGTLKDAWPQTQKYLSDKIDSKSLNETKEVTFKGEKAMEVGMSGIWKENKTSLRFRVLIFKRKGILYDVQFTAPADKFQSHEKDMKALEAALKLLG
jgi:hypothetical protein